MPTQKPTYQLSRLEQRSLMDMIRNAFGLSIAGEVWLYMQENFPQGYTVAQMMEEGRRIARLRPPEYFKEVSIFDPDSLVPSDTAWTLIDTDKFSASRS